LVPFGSLGAVFGLGTILEEVGGLTQLGKQVQRQAQPRAANI
jgi:hypothetical protein